MKLHTFVSRPHEVSTYLGEFPPDTPGQETELLSIYEVIDIIYHSMSTMWKNIIIKQGFNDAN